MYDTHMHTKPFSTDSEMVLSEVLKSQEELGIGIVLTEHMDYDFPPPDVYEFDTETYFEKYASFRSDRLLLGVEIGLQKQVAERNRKLIRSCPFDMVIGSVHTVLGKDLYAPSFFRMFPDKKQAYTAYLETVYQNIRDFDDFDTLGHLDYVCRKAPYSDPLLHYGEFPEYIDEILKLLAKKGKSLEINTRLSGNAAAVKELETICSRFTELGGETVTIGSDAHHASAIGSSLESTYELAGRCRLRPVVYRRRRMCDAR